jgi:hypothetical protein
MSVHVTSAVWRQSNAEGSARLILLRLADQASDEGWCWPSHQGIAQNCRVSVATVKRVLAELEAAGELVRWRRGRQVSNVYRVLVGTPVEAAPPAHLGVKVIAQNEPSRDSSPDAQVIAHSCDPQSVREPSVERTSEQVLSRAGSIKPLRTPDPLWDALVKATRYSPESPSERGRWNLALKKLRQAQATPEQIATRAAVFRRKWPTLTLTPTGLEAHWGLLGDQSAGRAEIIARAVGARP